VTIRVASFDLRALYSDEAGLDGKYVHCGDPNEFPGCVESTYLNYKVALPRWGATHAKRFSSHHRDVLATGGGFGHCAVSRLYLRQGEGGCKFRQRLVMTPVAHVHRGFIQSPIRLDGRRAWGVPRRGGDEQAPY
jgi:hypothetical protein